MIENSTKVGKVIDNTQWKEHNQFVLSANGNIICQRYFKVNGFNPKSIYSVELLDTFRDIVDMIKADLVSKSRIYTALTMDKRSKLTGFYQGEELSMSDSILVSSKNIDGEVELSNGTVLNKTFIDYDITEDEEEEEPFEFKFAFIYDDKVIYEEVWDGTVYPKYIRNSVDLSNSTSSYRYTDPMRMTFSQQMTKHLVEGHKDLIYTIIRMLCTALSNEVDEDGKSTEREFTEDIEYGGKTYELDTYPRDFVRSWANDVRQKTIQYKRWAEWDLPKARLDYIDRYM